MEKPYMTKQDINQLKSYRKAVEDVYISEQKILAGLLAAVKYVDKTAPNSDTNDPKILNYREKFIDRSRDEEKGLLDKMKNLTNHEDEVLKMLKAHKKMTGLQKTVTDVRIWAQLFQISLYRLRKMDYVLDEDHAAAAKRTKSYVDDTGYLHGVEECDFEQTFKDVRAFKLDRMAKLKAFDEELKKEEDKVNEIEKQKNQT